MKSLCIFLTSFLFISMVSAQELYSEASTEDGLKFLLGPITPQLLKQGDYREWFMQNYESYEPEQQLLPALSKSLEKHHILVFLGTWCGDSKREVPRFLRILDEADFPSERLKIIAVDRREPNIKKSPGGEEWGLQIKRVPTFIFLQDGREVNRIVESPVESLEKDMLLVLGRKEYEPNYAELMKSK